VKKGDRTKSKEIEKKITCVRTSADQEKGGKNQSTMGPVYRFVGFHKEWKTKRGGKRKIETLNQKKPNPKTPNEKEEINLFRF